MQCSLNKGCLKATWTIPVVNYLKNQKDSTIKEKPLTESVVKNFFPSSVQVEYS